MFSRWKIKISPTELGNLLYTHRFRLEASKGWGHPRRPLSQTKLNTRQNDVQGERSRCAWRRSRARPASLHIRSSHEAPAAHCTAAGGREGCLALRFHSIDTFHDDPLHAPDYRPSRAPDSQRTTSAAKHRFWLSPCALSPPRPMRRHSWARASTYAKPRRAAAPSR